MRSKRVSFNFGPEIERPLERRFKYGSLLSFCNRGLKTGHYDLSRTVDDRIGKQPANEKQTCAPEGAPTSVIGANGTEIAFDPERTQHTHN